MAWVVPAAEGHVEEQNSPDDRACEEHIREPERHAVQIAHEQHEPDPKCDEPGDGAHGDEQAGRPVDAPLAHENAAFRGSSFVTFWSSSIASRSAFVSFLGTLTRTR